MGKFELDFSELDELFSQKQINKIPVMGNEDKMIRVAFDLFRLDGNSREDLWQVQADDDGMEFLVRTYSLPEEEEKISTSEWEVLLDKKASNLTIVYNGTPVKRLSTSDYNISNTQEAELFRGVVLKKIATDNDFQNLLLGPFGGKHSGEGPLGGTPHCKRNLQEQTFESPLQLDGVIVFVDEDKKEEKDDSPSEDYSDPDNWWDNLNEGDKEELFEKFKDVPSITKKQALKLINMELKLAGQKK